jgi:hypothetical protein|tara:strand:+ start:771 stop:980 length:210 start_codon:yes stop_codon:yes gene_type:complete
LKNNSKKIKKSLKIIDKIQKIRSKNNRNWMDLLRLAITLDHKKSSNILKEIVKDDKSISKLADQISKMR